MNLERDKKRILALARQQARKQTDRTFLEELLVDVQKIMNKHKKILKYIDRRKVIPRTETVLLVGLLGLEKKIGDRLKMKGG